MTEKEAFFKAMFDLLTLKVVTSYKLNRLRTKFCELLFPADQTRVIWIFGCQRSGTTMISEILGFSPFVNHYGEGDLPYFFQAGHPRYLRIVGRQRLKKLLRREKSRFTLLKPLYDSQIVAELLDFAPGSKAVWVFRHYLDTVDSHIKNYRNDHDGVIYTRELFNRKKKVWKNENLPAEIRAILDEFAHRAINSATGYALFWLARNSLYSHIRNHPDVLLANYEDIVSDPVTEFSRIFAFTGVPFRPKYASIVHSRAYKKRINFEIDPAVRRHCEKMYADLRNMLPSASKKL